MNIPHPRSMHPVARVRHRKLWADAFEGPGTRLQAPPMSATAAALKLAARRKLEREEEAGLWLIKVKARKVAK